MSRYGYTLQYATLDELVRALREAFPQQKGLPLEPKGCVCPPTSEQTCMSQFCPRKPVLAQVMIR